jgi:AraC family transcriptional regulator of arabinose operon
MEIAKNQDTRPEYDSYLFPGRTEAWPGYYCPLHRKGGSRDWLLVYTVSGEGRFDCAGGSVEVGRGDAVLVRPGTPYDLFIGEDCPYWDSLWAHFVPRPHWFDWLRWTEDVPGILTVSAPAQRRGRVEELLRRLLDYWNGGGPLSKMFAMAMLEQVLLECAAFAGLAADGPSDHRIRTAVEYIRQNLSAAIAVTDLARVAGMSPSRLARVFKEETGQTPQQFIEERRMALARQRLALTGRSIKEIAAEAGYDDALYFSRRFKQHAGASPMEYRRR